MFRLPGTFTQEPPMRFSYIKNVNKLKLCIHSLSFNIVRVELRASKGNK